ncbi:YncE family protein [Sphingomonas nostoxanthinifaciens]|uniref:YncE family protein n=1 Tax=Sphingomonas nostoxanthinifaciens TaxID=2872652 RepID=UPI001CC20E9F|nr:WD40 repeat domain-containing protein [Sphingomonas nostoxanthinifaciens]UAK25796.1 WD40 repeat domain-containing protein [Sphingomonas nostoxanthinifaciens]
MKITNFVATLRRTAAACLIASLTAAAHAAPVLTLEKSVAMPQIKSGDFDHFGVDLRRGKIYTSAQHARTIEVFDLKTGAHLQTVGGFINPHSIFYAPTSDRIILADGGESLKEPALVKFIDPVTMKVVKSFTVRPGPDAAFYDQASHLFYNGSGGKDAGQKDSLFAVFNADNMTEVARTVVPSENIEEMAVDTPSHRLFMNLRDQHAIGVFDTKANRFVTKWVIPGMNMNTPMDYDPATHRLFVVGRDPGRVYVIDGVTGKLLSTTDCPNGSDDVAFDAKGQRLFVSASDGFAVLKRRDADHFALVQTGTRRGAKTSVYVPSVGKLFIGHAATGADPTSLDIYRVAPTK